MAEIIYLYIISGYGTGSMLMTSFVGLLNKHLTAIANMFGNLFHQPSRSHSVNAFWWRAGSDSNIASYPNPHSQYRLHHRYAQWSTNVLLPSSQQNGATRIVQPWPGSDAIFHSPSYAPPSCASEELDHL